MNKQEVIDYVMSTPYNVNRTILSQSLDEIGTQADWNQNDPTKPDYIKNKPEIGSGYDVVIELTKTDEGWFDAQIVSGTAKSALDDAINGKPLKALVRWSFHDERLDAPTVWSAEYTNFIARIYGDVGFVGFYGNGRFDDKVIRHFEVDAASGYVSIHYEE